MDIQFTETPWPKTLFDDSEGPRQEGLHLSTVVRSIQQHSGILPSGGFRDMELTAEVGLLWELVLSRVMREKYALRPPQIKVDGIWMSPDGVGFTDPVGSMSIGPDPADEVAMVVEEYKATWQSVKRCPTENFSYMTQIKSYCHAIGTNIAVMRIFYIMGDYKGSGPLYRIARIKFSDRELKENWDMIIRHKNKYLDEK